MNDSAPLQVERRIAAPPTAVYAFLTESERWARWQGAEAELDAAPGGLFRMAMGNGMQAEGRFVELVPASASSSRGAGSGMRRCRLARPRSRSTFCPTATERSCG